MEEGNIKSILDGRTNVVAIMNSAQGYHTIFDLHPCMLILDVFIWALRTKFVQLALSN